MWGWVYNFYPHYLFRGSGMLGVFASLARRISAGFKSPELHYEVRPSWIQERDGIDEG